MKFKNKWDLNLLYNICLGYLNNQTEENALNLIEKIENYKNKYCE